jgi:hypothetical protein
MRGAITEQINAVSLHELTVSMLAMADAVTKLLIEKMSSRRLNSSRSCWRGTQRITGF